jgi:hypothetical protein
MSVVISSADKVSKTELSNTDAISSVLSSPKSPLSGIAGSSGTVVFTVVAGISRGSVVVVLVVETTLVLVELLKGIEGDTSTVVSVTGAIVVSTTVVGLSVFTTGAIDEVAIGASEVVVVSTGSVVVDVVVVITHVVVVSGTVVVVVVVVLVVLLVVVTASVVVVGDSVVVVVLGLLCIPLNDNSYLTFHTTPSRHTSGS